MVLRRMRKKGYSTATANEFPTKINAPKDWATKGRNGRSKKERKRVKIHIFHLVAHASLKCVIIRDNLWHYSIVVIWHIGLALD